MPANHVVLTRSRGNRELRSMAAGWGGVLTDPAAIPPYPGYGQTVAGLPINAHSALQVPAVFTAIRIIAFTLGKLGDPYPFRWKTDPNSGFRYRAPVDQDFPVLSNTFGADEGLLMNYDGRNRTTSSMAMFGEAWWYTIDRDRNAQPLVLEPLNPLLLELKHEQVNGQTVRKAFYGVGKDRVELDPSRLRHIPLLARPGDERGLSSLRYLGIAMGLALASLEFGSMFFAQGASPSFLLTSDRPLSPAHATQIAEKFLVEHGGLSQSHLPLVLDNGLTAQKIQSTPDEAQFNQTLTTAYICIASWFGVPQFWVGDTAGHANPYGPGATEEMMRQFTTTTLAGYITALEEAYSRLLPAGVFAGFDVSLLHQPDVQALAAEIQALRQSQVASVNDLRVRKLRWAPSSDPDADKVIQPLASNVSPAQTEGSDAGSDDENDTP